MGTEGYLLVAGDFALGVLCWDICLKYPRSNPTHRSLELAFPEGKTTTTKKPYISIMLNLEKIALWIKRLAARRLFVCEP